MYNVTVHTEFNAAHRLREYNGKCESLHGHNWAVEVKAGAKKLNKIGMVVDFTELKKEVYELLEELDHKYLNELKPFKKNNPIRSRSAEGRATSRCAGTASNGVNPTSENIAKYIHGGLKSFCKVRKIKLTSVTVWETPTSSATYAE